VIGESLTMNTRLSVCIILSCISLLISSCWNPLGIPDEVEVNLDANVQSRSDLGSPTLQRIDDANRRMEAIRQTLATGLEVGPETRGMIRELNQTVLTLNQSTTENFESGMTRVDALLTILENDIGIKVEASAGLDPATLNTVDQLIDTIDSAPGQWGSVGLEIINALEASTSAVGKEMANEVNGILQQAQLDSRLVISAMGGEFRCNVDFLGTKVGTTVDELIGKSLVGRIRNVVTGESPEPQILIPSVCQILPETVNLIKSGEKLIFERQDTIKISGYNFTEENLPVAYVVDETHQEKVDSIQLSPFYSSPYQVQLNLYDIDFSSAPPRSLVVFEWPNVSSKNYIALLPPLKPTPTATLEPRPKLIVNAPTVNVRSGPGTNYQPPIGQAQQGAEFDIIGRNGDSSWLQIDYIGENGWISRDLVIVSNLDKIEDVSVALNIPLPPPPPPPPACPEPNLSLFTASPPNIKLGDEIVLRWAVEQADNVAIQYDTKLLGVELTGELKFSPQNRTVYQLIVGYCGGKQKLLGEVEVGVEVNTPTPTFTPRPTFTPAPTTTPLPECHRTTEYLPEGVYHYYPPHTRGDRELDGDTRIKVIAGLNFPDNNNRRVRFVIQMTAEEIGGDHSTAHGSEAFDLYVAPPGYKMETVRGAHSDEIEYVDRTHYGDTFERGSGGPVKKFVVYGDRDGNDIGEYTSVKVEINPLEVRLVQVGQCRN